MGCDLILLHGAYIYIIIFPTFTICPLRPTVFVSLFFVWIEGDSNIVATNHLKAAVYNVVSRESNIVT